MLLAAWLPYSGPVLAQQVATADGQEKPRVQFDSPRGGWHRQTPEGARFLQRVSYPASSVESHADQADSARIRGRVLGASKEPATLIVNGVPMPVRIEHEGSFDRPYSFPAGSNSVELRSADGLATGRVQSYGVSAGASAARLRVVLSWDSDHTDLDLHVISPDGAHAWYGQRSLDNGGALDVDVTTGYGPEIYATPSPLPGTYLVYVNFYGGSAAQDLTVARISVISREGSIDEKSESVRVPMRHAGELVLVKRFSYP
jgi:uncharacterized protein YfaP (DUF2135 family)